MRTVRGEAPRKRPIDRAIWQGRLLMEDFIPAKFPDVRRNQGCTTYFDYKNVVVVAGVWLLFYVVMLSGLLSNQGRDLLASISNVLAQN
jgi:hypothetical protein